MCAGPTSSMRGGPGQGVQHKSLVHYVAQENSEEESSVENEKEVTAKKRHTGNDKIEVRRS